MRLIDADALLEKLAKTPRYFTVKFDIEEQPTVDAVPVVRCRECKFCYTTGYSCGHRCGLYIDLHPVGENDFCSYGVRKEAEHDEKEN